MNREARRHLLGRVPSARRSRSGRPPPGDCLAIGVCHRRAPTVLFLPLTTQTDALRFPGTALVEVTAENGLKRPSVALAFQLTVVDKQYIDAYLGTLSSSAFNAVRQALDDITERA